MEEQQPTASPRAFEGQSTAVPDLSQELREKRPHLWEAMREQNELKERLAESFAEKIRSSGVTPDQFPDLLRQLVIARGRGILDKEFPHDFTSVTGWNPREAIMFGNPCVKLGEGKDFPFSPRLSTFRLGVEMATIVADESGREVMQVPYPSFDLPVKPLERVVGVGVTQVGWYRFTPEQFGDLQRVVSRPAAQLLSQPPPPAA